MSRRDRPRVSTFLGLALVGLFAYSARADDAAKANASRLRAMPIEQRQQLAKALERFDVLDGGEQSTIRELDRQLAEQAPKDRERYLGVLRRYHLWVRSLPEAQQQALREAKPDERLALATKFREQQRQAKPDSRPGDWIQVSALNAIPLVGEALLLKTWFALDREGRKQIEQVKEPERKIALLLQQAARLRIGREFRDVSEEFRAEMEAVEKEFNLPLVQAAPKNNQPAKKKAGVELVRSMFFGKNDKVRRVVEARFLIDHEPAPVRRENLDRFEAEMPPWIRASLDPLPPDAARRRLLVLYRLVFPPDHEITEIKPIPPEELAPKAAPPPSGESKKTSRPTGGVNPF